MSREDASDHLLVEWAKWHGAVPELFVAAVTGFDPAEHFAAQLEALVAVGLLDPDEASEWRRSFSGNGRPPTVEVDAALRERIDAYLSSLRGSAGDDDPGPFEGALRALAEVGAISHREAGAWLGHLHGDGDGDWSHDEDAEADIGAADLRRVVLGPAAEAGGVRVLAVELYPRGLIVRWTAHDFVDLTVSDEAGTAYEEVAAEGDEYGGTLVRGESTFVPAVPEAATRLTVEVEGDRLEVDLSL